MTIETKRLRLRYWKLSDAEVLYKYAKDERVGPVAGWPPHKSVEESRGVILTVFGGLNTFAIVLKDTDEPIGCIGAVPKSEIFDGERFVAKEVELGYWLGVPHWGKGLMTEAAMAMIDYLFDKQGCTAVWCGYYEGNERSRRVQEKCGFVYHHTDENVRCELVNDIRTEHFSRLTKREFLEAKFSRIIYSR